LLDAAHTPSGFSVWLGKSSLVAFGVTIALTVITLVVELILLVRRDSCAARTEAEAGRRPQ
jgi:hypothetical protein